MAAASILAQPSELRQKLTPHSRYDLGNVTNISDLRYDRVCRTASSEAYLLSDGEEPVGRVDLHFGASVVHGLLVLERELEGEALAALVQRVDDDLVWTADQPRDDFLLTVYRGEEVALFSDTPDEDTVERDGETEP